MNIGLIKPFIHNSNSKQKESASIDNITYNSFSPKQMIIWLHLISETLQDIWADFFPTKMEACMNNEPHLM